MNKAQSLINAQVSVSRAVFEYNAPGREPGAKPRLEYLAVCVTEAIKELKEFEKANKLRSYLKKAQ